MTPPLDSSMNISSFPYQKISHPPKKRGREPEGSEPERNILININDEAEQSRRQSQRPRKVGGAWNDCDTLLILLKERLYCLENPKEAIKEIKEALPKRSNLNPYHIYWNIVNLRPSAFLWPTLFVGKSTPDNSKNLFRFNSGDGLWKGVENIPPPNAAQAYEGEGGYNPLFDPERPKHNSALPIDKRHTTDFYKIVENCGIKINQGFFLQMIAPEKENNRKNLPTYLFVNDNDYQYVIAEYDDNAMVEDEEHSYYPAILYTDSDEIQREAPAAPTLTVDMKDGSVNKKLVFMDMEPGLTGNIYQNSRKRLSSYKDTLIEETNKLINQLLKNAEAPPSTNKIAQIFENPSDNCKEALKKICEKYNTIKTDDGVLRNFVREDTRISGGYGESTFVMPNVVEPSANLLSLYGSIAYWALGPQDDRDNIQSIFTKFKSSSGFPEPDLPRLENFKFSAMPDGSIYVEEEEEEIADKFNGLKISAMPDGSFLVELK